MSTPSFFSASSSVEYGNSFTFVINFPTGFLNKTVQWRLLSGSSLVGIFDKVEGTTPAISSDKVTITIKPKLTFNRVDPIPFNIAVYPVGTSMTAAKTTVLPWAVSGEFNLIQRQYSATITSDKTSYKEGETVKFSLVTSGIPDATKLVVRLSGDISSSDISGGILNKEVLIAKNAASISYSLVSDFVEEAEKTFKLEVLTPGTVLATAASASSFASSQDLTLSDVYRTASIITKVGSSPTLNAVSTSVSEGQTVYFNITTTNVNDRTSLMYKIIGNGITIDASKSSDTSLSSNIGSVLITRNAAVIAVAIKDDGLVETDETIKLQLFKPGTTAQDINTSTPWVESEEISINDISRTATIAATATSGLTGNTITEGSIIQFTITTTNIADNTSIACKIAGNNFSRADIQTVTGFNGVPNYGNYLNPTNTSDLTTAFKIIKNKAIVTVTLADDLVPESDETIKLQIFRPGVAMSAIADNTPWAESADINIADIVRTAGITAKIGQNSYINESELTTSTTLPEGQSAYFFISTTNIPDKTELLYKIVTDTVTLDDLSYISKFTGSFLINANKGRISVSALDDEVSEASAPESFKIQVFPPGTKLENINSIPPWLESPVISISDTPKAVSFKSVKIGKTDLTLTEKTDMLEGEKAVIEFNANFPNDTKIVYAVEGSNGLSRGDFFYGPPLLESSDTKAFYIGISTVKNNIATITLASGEDYLKESNESFKVKLLNPKNTQAFLDAAKRGTTRTFSDSYAAKFQNLVAWAESPVINITDTNKTISIVTKSGTTVANAVESTTSAEGKYVVFDITTTNVPDGSELIYYVTGQGIDSNDVTTSYTAPTLTTPPANFSRVKIMSNKGQVAVLIKTDIIEELSDKIKLVVYPLGVTPFNFKNIPNAPTNTWIESDEISLTELPKSVDITVSNTSVVSESTVTFTVTCNNFPIGISKLYYVFYSADPDLKEKYVSTAFNSNTNSVKIINGIAVINQKMGLSSVTYTGNVSHKLVILDPSLSLDAINSKNLGAPKNTTSNRIEFDAIKFAESDSVSVTQVATPTYEVISDIPVTVNNIAYSKKTVKIKIPNIPNNTTIAISANVINFENNFTTVQYKLPLGSYATTWSRETKAYACKFVNGECTLPALMCTEPLNIKVYVPGVGISEVWKSTTRNELGKPIVNYNGSITTPYSTTPTVTIVSGNFISPAPQVWVEFTNI